MNINLKDLKCLLSSAFDAGWFGYKETKEDCIEKIIEDYIDKNLNNMQKNETTTTNYFENYNPNYYSYYASSIGSNQLTLSTISTNEVI